ncbi:unnamed protein product [Nippostrongylus brasiliensis]|uniref:DUF667 domain-containing protein n=1 Tax=Nippostrongylus brasiliensis TaxID=27835 RepID=A0A0N4XVV4_NIPBR|nr:unnamed protein product [Nippostrongylus brasiliensis]
MGSVRAEFVKNMTAPERSFHAIVRDHHSNVLEQVTFTHPMCWKLKITVNDLLILEQFDFAPPEQQNQRSKDKMLRKTKRRDEHRPNFWFILDPQRRRRKLQLLSKNPHHQKSGPRETSSRDPTFRKATTPLKPRHKQDRQYGITTADCF